MFGIHAMNVASMEKDTSRDYLIVSLSLRHITPTPIHMNFRQNMKYNPVLSTKIEPVYYTALFFIH